MGTDTDDDGHPAPTSFRGWKDSILRRESADGRRHLPGRRLFNRALRAGRIAVKKDPALWELSKGKACTEAKLCDHSARRMQWATSYYQKHGGEYVGPKRSDNSLSVWGREKWQTRDGSKSRTSPESPITKRYMPAEAWKMLSEKEKRETDAAKRRGSLQGKQFVRNPPAAARASRLARSRSRRRSRGRAGKRRGAASA